LGVAVGLGAVAGLAFGPVAGAAALLVGLFLGVRLDALLLRPGDEDDEPDEDRDEPDEPES
jgi:hypothetical protein